MYFKFHSTSTITVDSHPTLLPIWRGFDPQARALIGHVIVKKPLTAAQLRRLPAGLKTKLIVG